MVAAGEQREPDRTKATKAKTTKGKGKAKPAQRAETVRVSYSPYDEDRPFVGQTVGAVRQALAEAWGIDPNITAFVNGESASDKKKLVAGDRLEFARKAGRKG